MQATVEEVMSLGFVNEVDTRDEHITSWFRDRTRFMRLARMRQPAEQGAVGTQL